MAAFMLTGMVPAQASAQAALPPSSVTQGGLQTHPAAEKPRGPVAEYTAPAKSPFRDVSGSQQFYKEMAWLADNTISTGWTEADGSKTYRALTPVNRDAMAAFMYRLSGTPEFTAPTVSPFADVTPGQEHYKAMGWLARQGISTGWEGAGGTKLYKATAPVNRDAMAAFLYRLARSPAYTPPAVSPFADVSTTQQFYKEMAWLASTGISTGWDGAGGTKLYKAVTPVNRDAMAAFMYRYDTLLREKPVITVKSLTEGTAGLDYLAVLVADGGSGNLKWSATGLPAGLAMSADGVISGVPARIGTNSVTIGVVDAAGASTKVGLTLDVPRSVPAGCINKSCATVTTSPSTVAIPAAQITKTTLDAAGAVNTVTLAGPSPAVGKVLVLAPTTELPTGAIVRVKKVAAGAGGNITTVVPAKLDEAYPTGEIHLDSHDTAPAAAAAVESAKGEAGSAGAITAECSPGLKPKINSLSTVPNLTPQMDYKWGLNGPEYASVGYNGTIDVKVDATMTGAGSCTLTAPKVTRVIPAGYIPITLSFQPSITLKASVAVNVKATVTFTCQTLYQYTSSAGAAEPQQHCTPTNTKPELGDGNEASVELVGAAAMEVGILRLAGFDGEVNAGVHVTHNPKRDPKGMLVADIGYEINFCLGCVFDKASKDSKYAKFRLDYPLASGTLWTKTLLVWSGGPLTPDGEPLSSATVGQAYKKQLTAKGGKPVYTFVLFKGSGNLPEGLELQDDGTIKGTPTRAGTSTFTVWATDEDSNRTSLEVNLVVEDHWVPFTTSDGAYSFVHPSEWRVEHRAYSTSDVYTVTRKDGTYIASLDTRLNLPDGIASPTYPQPNGVSLDVPGLSRPLGRKVTAIIGSHFGQYAGGEGIVFSTADGGDPYKNWGWVQVPRRGFVQFMGSGGDIGNHSSMLTAAETKIRVDAYLASSEGKSVQRMLTSLSMRP
jgi:hypothetical protein